MGTSLRGFFVGVFAAVALYCLVGRAQPSNVQAAGSAAGLSRGIITHYAPATANQQDSQLTLVDTQQLILAVYSISRSSGEITLKSVRPISWDLALSDFNSTDPQPEAIKNMIQQRR